MRHVVARTLACNEQVQDAGTGDVALPRGHAWRRGPACPGKRAMASFNAYKKHAPKPNPRQQQGE